jgi:hypothetical protein
MKKVVSILLAGLALFVTFSALIIVSTDAGARGRSSGSHSHASGARSHSSGVRSQALHSGARVGVYIGAPIITSSWWMYPDPYYAYGPYFPPVVQGQEQSVVYVEQQAPSDVAPSAPLAQQYWYYCEDSKTYYPYVQDCATPWQTVVPYALQ